MVTSKAEFFYRLVDLANRNLLELREVGPKRSTVVALAEIRDLVREMNLRLT